MADKEALVNAKKDELLDLTKKHGKEKCSPVMEMLIEKITEISKLLQEMYIETRAEKLSLEDEVKKLKSVINTLTT